MENLTENAPLLIECANIKINVFRVGKSPRLTNRTVDSHDPVLMRGVHTHFTYEVFFVVSGELELVTDEYSRTYGKGILIIPPKLRHYTFTGVGDSFCLLFSFENTTDEAQRLRRVLDKGIAELSMSDDIAFYIKRFAEKSDTHTPKADRDAALLCSLIFSEMTEQMLPAHVSQKSNGSSEHIGNIEAYINKNLLNKITLSSVSESVHLSSKQISRIIERAYGCTFLELLTQKRLAAAEMLLKNTDMRISEIAAATFHSTETYFYTVFKKYYGMTPLKYRKESQINK